MSDSPRLCGPDPGADFEISDLRNDSIHDEILSVPADELNSTDEEKPLEKKRVRVRDGRLRVQQTHLFRSTFRHDKYYDKYSDFVRDVRFRPTTLPDATLIGIKLDAFPKKYRSPIEVPKKVQKMVSAARFFYVRDLVYRSALGHALYIVPKRAAEQGRILSEFVRYSGRREVFRRNPDTGSINYLGEFQLVKSALFPYCFRECGGFPELSVASVPPIRGNYPPPSVFCVLQFMRYNHKVLDEFLTV